MAQRGRGRRDVRGARRAEPAPAVGAVPVAAKAKLVKRQAELEAAKKALLAQKDEWLSWSEGELMDLGALTRRYLGLVGVTDVMRAEDEKDSKGGLEKARAGMGYWGDDRAAPSTRTGVIAALGEAPATPAFLAYAGMRANLLARRADVRGALREVPGLDAELRELKRELGEGGSGEDELPAPLPKVISIGMSSIFAFLAAAAARDPALCMEPVRILSSMLAGFDPQVRGAARRARGSAGRVGGTRVRRV